jgi:hypothetical protein
MSTLQLSQGHPDAGFADREPYLRAYPSLQIRNRGLAVAVVPDRHGGAVQAVSLFALRVVENDLLVEHRLQ